MDGFVSGAESGLEAAANGELLEFWRTLPGSWSCLKGPVDHPLPVIVM